MRLGVPGALQIEQDIVVGYAPGRPWGHVNRARNNRWLCAWASLATCASSDTLSLACAWASLGSCQSNETCLSDMRLGVPGDREIEQDFVVCYAPWRPWRHVNRETHGRRLCAWAHLGTCKSSKTRSSAMRLGVSGELYIQQYIVVGHSPKRSWEK